MSVSPILKNTGIQANRQANKAINLTIFKSLTPYLIRIIALYKYILI